MMSVYGLINNSSMLFLVLVDNTIVQETNVFIFMLFIKHGSGSNSELCKVVT